MSVLTLTWVFSSKNYIITFNIQRLNIQITYDEILYFNYKADYFYFHKYGDI